MNRLLTNSVILLLIILTVSCNYEEAEKRFIVGFSQCRMNDEWRKTMYQDMQRELLLNEDINLIFKNANGVNEIQVQQIEMLIQEGIDLLIVSPNEAEAITAVIEKAYKMNIPVILLDRKINSESYTSFIGANNNKIGKAAGEYIYQLLNGQGKVLEAYELEKITAFNDRSEGFNSVLSDYDNIKLDKVRAMQAGYKNFKTLVQENQYDAIFAHTDVAAKFAYDILDSLGSTKNCHFIGVDGLAANGGGIELVEQDILSATLLYPTGGDKAIEVAKKILNGEEFKRINELSTTIVDSTNVTLMRIQSEKLSNQTEDINELFVKIDTLISVYRSQKNLIYLFAFMTSLAIVLAALVYKALSEKRKTNQQLEEKNKEILKYARNAEKANEAKFEFFTNISHEFRTPLTLINGPVEELMLDNQTKPFRNELNLIRNNANRLLRLVNQLMDFRKIDSGKVRLNASKTDIVLFTEEIYNIFKSIAQKQNIDFRLIKNINNHGIWFDRNQIDKVIFNLLSNAFKFTPDKGRITIKIDVDEINNYTKLIVEDSGLGMTKNEVSRVFDRFYKGEKNNYFGTGIGLALSKEIIDLHHWNINVYSEENKGTKIEITMKEGFDHFSPSQLKEDNIREFVHDDINVFDEQSIDEVIKNTSFQKDHSLLLIDDNKELRNYLKNRFIDVYEIYEASNVEEGISMAQDNIPDIIICDLMIGNESGFDIIKELKSDIRSSHIPIIILSAKNAINDQIKGIQLGADDYIPKPFNVAFLKERVRMMLINRRKLMNHLISGLPIESSLDSTSRLEKKFINDFSAIVENNIGNNDFGVNEICKEIGLSRVQLYRKVKALLGYSVNDYINTVKLNKAKYLLQNTDKSIAQIAFEIGFSSSAYFSTAFKSNFEVSPTEYRSSKK